MPCTGLFKKKSADKLLLDARSEVAHKFCNGFFDGSAAKFAAEGAVLQPPGSPEMPLGEEFYGMMAVFKKAFPQWTCNIGTVKKVSDNTFTVETQQELGKMVADLEAVGPFPGVKLADAPEWVKTTGMTFPYEVGTYTFVDGKVLKALYEGEISPKKSFSKEIKAVWGKKGDLSDVGFGALFLALGVELTKPAPCFYYVKHEFLEGKAEVFWNMIGSMDADGWVATGEKANSLGFHNHNFLPSSDGKHVLCLWECASETSPEVFATFINGEDGPAPGVFNNTCFKVMPGATLPDSHFAAGMPKANHTPPAQKTSGSFFYVEHEFVDGKAGAFWEMIQGMGPEDWAAMAKKNQDLGFHNHFFMPSSPEGPLACVWESKEPTTVEEMQKFVDGPNGPAPGVFINNVNLVVDGSKHPAPSFAASPCFYYVKHEFLEGKAEVFWNMIGSMDADGWVATGEKANSLGFHNHNFLPSSDGKHVLCLWECASETSPEVFATFINGEDGPAPGVFNNTCFKVMPGATLPDSHFAAGMPKANHTPPAQKTSGSFFYVEHEFVDGKAGAFWEMIQGMGSEDWAAMAKKNQDLGFHNHFFMPSSPEGPLACVWESKEPTTVEEMQKFVDGPNGPAPGVFINNVNLVVDGSKHPEAAFRAELAGKPASKTSSIAATEETDIRVE